MNRNKQILQLLVVMCIQVLIINHLQFLGICHPYIFIMFLIMMPITLPHSIEMILAMGVGLVMDLFCNSLGVHMAACVLISYLRRLIIGNLVMDMNRLKGEINSHSIGSTFIKYALIIIILYHMMVVLLSAWSFAHVGLNVLQILLSSLLSGLMIIGYDFLQNK